MAATTSDNRHHPYVSLSSGEHHRHAPVALVDALDVVVSPITASQPHQRTAPASVQHLSHLIDDGMPLVIGKMPDAADALRPEAVCTVYVASCLVDDGDGRFAVNSVELVDELACRSAHDVLPCVAFWFRLRQQINIPSIADIEFLHSFEVADRDLKFFARHPHQSARTSAMPLTYATPYAAIAIVAAIVTSFTSSSSSASRSVSSVRAVPYPGSRSRGILSRSNMMTHLLPSSLGRILTSP